MASVTNDLVGRKYIFDVSAHCLRAVFLIYKRDKIQLINQHEKPAERECKGRSIVFYFLTIIENQDDKAYIAYLYKKYYPLLKKQAHSIVWEQGVVDDLIQDAFLKLIPKIRLLRTLNRYQRTSYIVYTLRHVCLDYIRKKSRRSKHMFLGATEDIAPVLTATGDEFAHTEMHDELEQALLQLTERDRSLLFFKYYMEMTDKEIACLSGIPADHVRQYVARARHRALRFLSNGVKGEN